MATVKINITVDEDVYKRFLEIAEDNGFEVGKEYYVDFTPAQ